MFQGRDEPVFSVCFSCFGGVFGCHDVDNELCDFVYYLVGLSFIASVALHRC